jgi:hypothetical protein
MPMPKKQRRVVYILLVVVSVIGFSLGAWIAYNGRHNTICPNGRAPVAQQDDDMGQVMYLCTNGLTVTN